MEGEARWNFCFLHRVFLSKFPFTESESSKSSKTKNYLGIMLRLPFRYSCHKRGFFFMCCERGNTTANLVSLSSRRLLFELCSWKNICSTNFNIIIIKENLLTTAFSLHCKFPSLGSLGILSRLLVFRKHKRIIQ